MTPEITALASTIMLVYFLAFFPMGISVLSTYYLQSVLKGSRSFCISFLRNIALSTLLVCLLPQLFGGDVYKRQMQRSVLGGVFRPGTELLPLFIQVFICDSKQKFVFVFEMIIQGPFGYSGRFGELRKGKDVYKRQLRQ